MAQILREENIWHLRNDEISYVLCVMPGGIPAHLYFGPRLERLNAANLLRHAGVAADGSFSVQGCMLDRLPQEYPSFGLGDMRDGALEVEGPDGSWAVDLRMEKAEILEEKPALEGLPATRGEGSAALRVTLRDGHTGLAVILDYAVYDDCPTVTRSVRLLNGGGAPLKVTRALSLCLDLPDDGWELITLPGAWGRERVVCRRPLVYPAAGAPAAPRPRRSWPWSAPRPPRRRGRPSARRWSTAAASWRTPRSPSSARLA